MSLVFAVSFKKVFADLQSILIGPDSIKVCSDKLGINTKTGWPGDETFILGKIGEEVDKAIYAEETELNDILRQKNQFDIALYENAKGLFQRQALYSTK